LSTSNNPQLGNPPYEPDIYRRNSEFTVKIPLNSLIAANLSPIPDINRSYAVMLFTNKKI